MTQAELEARVLALERELAELKHQLGARPPGWRWWVEGAGEFANDAVFEEIVRRGKEYRDSLKPNLRMKEKWERG